MNVTTIPTIDWGALAPVLLLVLTGVAGLIIELLRPKAPNDLIVGVTVVGLLAALVADLAGQAGATPSSFGGMLHRDGFGIAMTAIILLSTLLVVLFSEPYLRTKGISYAEFYPLAMWSASGAIMMVTTKNLLMMFVGLEVLSVALYVLAGFSREEQKSEESAIKYFLLGAFASAFFLFGIAYVYGATGGLDLDQIQFVWPQGVGSQQFFLVLGLAFILIGLGFKGAIFPFHQWAPDVYQGAPTNVTAFMAIVSKVAAFATLWRILDAFGALSNLWMPVLFWAAVLTMFAGNLAALAQRDVKRIIGYSSIAHAGYLLVAVMAHAKAPQIVTQDAIVFYLFSYALMTIGTLAVISLNVQGTHDHTKLSDLHGLAKRSPLAFGCLVIFAFSLVGLPPTAGFFGKLMIITDAVRSGLVPLAVFMAINSAISAYYYLSLVWAAAQPAQEHHDEKSITKQPISLNVGLVTACLACAVGIFAAIPFVGQLTHLLAGR